MADYSYQANSNLVLASDRDSRRFQDEGKGEVETLNGKIDKYRMGDRIVNSSSGNDRKNKELVDKSLDNSSKRMRTGEHLGGTSKASKGSILQYNNNDSYAYQPKTKESKIAYEEILNSVQTLLGDQPQDVLHGAAEEVLSILKDNTIKDLDKHKEVNKILSVIPSELFHKLVNLSKTINDFNINGISDDIEDGKMEMDENLGVAVIFDDDDDDDIRQIAGAGGDGSDDEEEDGDEAQGSGMLKGDDQNMDVNDDNNNDGSIRVTDIDAHWLQRQLSKYYTDANISSKMAEETLNILQNTDERLCENNLVILLDFDKFDFIKILLKNRAKIYYCTRYKQAQSDDERQQIEQEMIEDVAHQGAHILQQLSEKASAETWAKDRVGEFAMKARKEARALNKESVTNDDDDFYNNKAASDIKSKEKVIDLESLSFTQGGHLMTNQRCELPEKSWRVQKKGYEEVHVPAVRPIIPSDERLTEISELPSWTHAAFPGIKSLNRIQSKMVSSALYSSDNILLCAPTGAGKTNVALLCMLNQIGQHLRDDGTVDLNAFKIVYIAPMKALVQECVLSFGKKLAPFGINVRELSGDQSLTHQQIKDTQVIVTTPEKWDIITRKSGERTYTQLVRLMIIDEIHLLHDERGAVLESLVARTIRQIETTQEMIRLVGLSATLPNYEDVATFLRVEPTKGLFFFDSSFRPVPLQQQYIGITEKKALKRFQLMNEICYEKVLQQAGKNQILIFTHSRAETVKTAKALRDLAVENDTLQLFVQDNSASKEILREESNSVKNNDLKELLPYGFAIHNAGMVKSDRALVEDLFADKHIQVLVSTATLAWGVNLPCHTVILKGTQMYSPEQGRWVELSPLDIMQMMGRAGRYGLDSEGEGIIITNHSELQYYLSLMNQQLPIESQLIKKLPDLLNAEIVLGTVTSMKEAAAWLGYSYLYVRMLKNHQLYGISDDDMSKDPNLLQRRMDLVHSAALLLDKHNLIKYDRKANNFQVTTLGRVASYYYISHTTMDTFNEYLKPSMNDIEVFRLFALSGEFKNINVREEEKLELTKLVTRVPIPIKESIDEPSAKINVLLQAYISRLKLDGFALVADMTYVQQSACRLMRGLLEIAFKKNWSCLASKILNICKMVERKIWLSQSPLRQFQGIPEIVIRKLEKNSDITWDKYNDLTAADFGEMVKMPKLGKSIHKYVHMVPKLVVTSQILPITRSLLKIDLTIMADFQYDVAVHDFSQMFWIMVEDNDGERLLHYESFILKSSLVEHEHHVSFTIPMIEPFPPQYYVKVVSDRWLHSEVTTTISFKNLLLPSKFPPSTELLDLQPLPVSVLDNEALQSRLYRGIKYFNPIQTQTYHALCESDESVLVCAPTGSGKTVCAELALIRLFATNINSKCVYIAPKSEILEKMYTYWSQRFNFLNINMVKLTGDTTVDLKLIEHGNLIFATANDWDSISRRWRQRKHIHSISLYIVDELHLVGSTNGPVLEVVVSRIRKIASILERPIRIIGLSYSLANAKDVGDWMGVSSQFIYNFAPDARPIPLEIYLQGYDNPHAGGRLLTMAKPVYNAILTHSPNKPVLIFVSSRKQTQLTAIDIISYVAIGDNPNRFLMTDLSDMTDVLSSIKDAALAQTLAKGVGFLHPGLHKSDSDRVESLYRDGIISILVCSYSLCWSIPVGAHLVVIMDTEYYDGQEQRYVDYSVTDIMQMVGLASRPLQDSTGKCVILCHTSKKDYLKKILYDPLPIESHLNHCLHDHLCAEVVAKVVENKEHSVDYMSWTLFYRRLSQNPNYYSLQGTSHRHLSDYLSDLVEKVITDLEESKCVAVENDFDIASLNLGMIASYYYIQYTTVELFASSITAKTKIKGLIDIIAAATEYNSIIIRQGEKNQLQHMAKHVQLAINDASKFEDPATKVNLLIQQHFARKILPVDLALDLKVILGPYIKLLQAIVDVISSQGWLKPALAAMELSQMVVQGMWDKDSVLLQIPHFNQDIVSYCNNHPSGAIETVYDVIELDDDVRTDILKNMSKDQVSDIATFCNSYPSIELNYQTSFNNDPVQVGEAVTVMISLQREGIDDEEGEVEYGVVIAPRYPVKKIESYWLVIGDSKSNTLLSIKRITLQSKLNVKLDFVTPEETGEHTLMLYLMSDSYLGCDQISEIKMNVIPGNDAMEM